MKPRNFHETVSPFRSYHYLTRFKVRVFAQTPLRTRACHCASPNVGGAAIPNTTCHCERFVRSNPQHRLSLRAVCAKQSPTPPVIASGLCEAIPNTTCHCERFVRSNPQHRLSLRAVCAKQSPTPPVIASGLCEAIPNTTCHCERFVRSNPQHRLSLQAVCAKQSPTLVILPRITALIPFPIDHPSFDFSN